MYQYIFAHLVNPYRYYHVVSSIEPRRQKEAIPIDVFELVGGPDTVLALAEYLIQLSVLERQPVDKGWDYQIYKEKSAMYTEAMHDIRLLFAQIDTITRKRLMLLRSDKGSMDSFFRGLAEDFLIYYMRLECIGQLLDQLVALAESGRLQSGSVSVFQSTGLVIDNTRSKNFAESLRVKRGEIERIKSRITNATQTMLLPVRLAREQQELWYRRQGFDGIKTLVSGRISARLKLDETQSVSVPNDIKAPGNVVAAAMRVISRLHNTDTYVSRVFIRL